MEFGATHLFFDNGEETETIYIDEVNDGIASCADEQAQVWAMTAEEEGKENDPFLKKLTSITRVCLDEKKREKNQVEQEKKRKEKEEEKGGRGKKPVGAFGCRTRVQPRMAGKGKQMGEFDRVVRERVRKENKEKVKGEEEERKLFEEAEREQMEFNLKGGVVENGENFSFSSFSSFSSSSSPSSSPFSGEEGEVVVIEMGSRMWKAGFVGEDGPRAVFPAIVGRSRHTGVMIGMSSKGKYVFFFFFSFIPLFLPPTYLPPTLDSYVGDEAQSKRGILTLKYPMDRGEICNFDDFEKLLHHTFYNELRIAPEECGVVLVCHSCISKVARHKMAQIMFEVIISYFYVYYFYIYSFLQMNTHPPPFPLPPPSPFSFLSSKTFNVPGLSILDKSFSSLLSTGRVSGVVLNIGARSTTCMSIWEGNYLYIVLYS